MAQAENIGDAFLRATETAAALTGLDFQNRMKTLTPVDEGTLRAGVQYQENSNKTVFRVFNQLDYAQRIYLEGHSKQLPVGVFQAEVAKIPQLFDSYLQAELQ